MSKYLFTSDHHGFYFEDQPFFPLIQQQPFPLLDCSNTVCLRLPAHLSDDLKWTKEIEIAKEISSLGKFILWDIDMRLSSFQFSSDNSADFFSFSVAVEEFAKIIWPEFQKQTFGVTLYRGNLPSEKNFSLVYWESVFSDWSKFGYADGSYDLFCIQTLSEYLHRLISFLPVEVLPFALIDVSAIPSPGKIAQLLSKERFEHIHLALKGARCPFSGICWEDGHPAQGLLAECPKAPKVHSPVSLGLYLPNDNLIDASIIQELDRIVFHFHENGIAFRIIPEEKLTEQWDGIEKLIVPAHSMSARGKRKLLGFAAAGGVIGALQGNGFEEDQLFHSEKQE